MYDDMRAVEEARRIDESGSWSHGRRIQASWALPKLLWLLREHRGLVRGTRGAHQADFINRRLAGCNVPTDSSNALKTGYDLISESWPHQAFAELGVPEEILPSVVRPGTPIGSVCAEASALTGIPHGTPIIAGMTDGCAAQVAAAALEIGSWNSVLGTTLVLKGVSKEPLFDPAGVIYSHRSPDGNWLPGAASSTGAGVLSRRFAGCDIDSLTRGATERQPSKLIAYPLAGRGERFPFEAPDAKDSSSASPPMKSIFLGQSWRGSAISSGCALII
jgi:sugar (pentulose or hexulose) kinase